MLGVLVSGGSEVEDGTGFNAKSNKQEVGGGRGFGIFLKNLLIERGGIKIRCLRVGAFKLRHSLWRLATYQNKEGFL